jgi:hypothetical protein
LSIAPQIADFIVNLAPFVDFVPAVRRFIIPLQKIINNSWLWIKIIVIEHHLEYGEEFFLFS